MWQREIRATDLTRLSQRGAGRGRNRFDVLAFHTVTAWQPDMRHVSSHRDPHRPTRAFGIPGHPPTGPASTPCSPRGFKAYMSVREKQRRHQAHLNSLFLLHNLNNNAGVISQLMGEAQEQVGGGRGGALRAHGGAEGRPRAVGQSHAGTRGGRRACMGPRGRDKCAGPPLPPLSQAPCT